MHKGGMSFQNSSCSTTTKYLYVQLVYTTSKLTIPVNIQLTINAEIIHVMFDELQ